MTEHQQDRLISAMRKEIDRLNLIIDGLNNSNSAAEESAQKWADKWSEATQ